MEHSSLDCGTISVQAKMIATGLPAPRNATLSRASHVAAGETSWAGSLITSPARCRADHRKALQAATQGKNERFHQALFSFLAKPLAATLGELQTQIDKLDRIFTTERPLQGLPGHVKPQEAWDATPLADPPRPLSPASPAQSPVTGRGRAPFGEHPPRRRQRRKQGQRGEVRDRQPHRRNTRPDRPR